MVHIEVLLHTYDRRKVAMNHNRYEALRALTELSELYPDVRLGQLVANLSYAARGLSNQSVWDMEDEELIAAANSMLADQRAHSAATV